jgi:hypothetical protein
VHRRQDQVPIVGVKIQGLLSVLELGMLRTNEIPSAQGPLSLIPRDLTTPFRFDKKHLSRSITSLFALTAIKEQR